MGVFIDSHARADFSDAALQRGLEDAERHTLNSCGACVLDFLVIEGGRVFCVIEAPNPAAVQRLHDELGLPDARAMAVEGAEGGSPLSDRDRELILRLIVPRDATKLQQL